MLATEEGFVSEDFIAVWREWSTQLQELGRMEDLFILYQQGCEVFVENDMLHYYMGCSLLKLSMKVEAAGMFRKALCANGQNLCAMEKLEFTSRRLIDGWHFAMLNDKKRNLCFSSAIKNSIKDTDCVLDIGSGTGILSMLAVKYSKAKIHSCEMLKIMQVIGSECISLNEMENKITSFSCDSNKLAIKYKPSSVDPIGYLDKQVSLVITETVDAGLFGEGIIDILHHAWEHLLCSKDQGGRVLPSRATLYCALIECEYIYKKHTVIPAHSFPGVIITSRVGEKEVNTSGKTGHGNGVFDMYGQLLHTSELEPYTSEKVKLIPHKVVTSVKKVMDVDFNDAMFLETMANGDYGHVFVDHDVIGEGFADAVVLWFDLEVASPEIMKCNNNLDEHVTQINTCISSDYCWEQAVFPIRCCKTHIRSNLDGSGCNNTVLERLCVETCDVINLDFKVFSDCLSLASVTDSAGISYPQNLSKLLQPDFASSSLHITAHEQLVERMNDVRFTNTYFQAVLRQFNSSNSCNILDISNGFDLLSIKLAKLLKVKIHKYCQTPAIQRAYCRLSQHCNQHLMLYNKIPSHTQTSFDIIVSEVIEPSGLISPDAIKNMFEAQMSLSHNGVMVPRKISLVAQCISSEELLSKCMVLSDENTLGFKIADIINDYRISTHSDLDLSHFSFKQLTLPEVTLEYCFDALPNTLTDAVLQQKSLVLKTIQSGIVHAILFWFKINVYNDEIIDTSKANHWKQAAYIFPKNKQLLVTSGEEIVLKSLCQNDLVSFSISTYGK
ncbi:unnamed protein product [Clavelina lepadiformis]|uniref:Uncharacterized protein n=1 Tax=Clavelina lepadiformis TaxID=159417 RepID=A0ABP0FC75_CLALP